MTDLRAALEAVAESVRTAIVAAVNAGPDDFVLAPEPRHTADSITDGDLDRLYARLAKAERAVLLLADSHRRADASEAEAAQLRADLDNRDETIRHLDAGLTHERNRAGQAESELVTVRSAADRVRALHRQVTYCGEQICAECSAYDERDCTDNSPCPCPCPTITALD